MSERLLFELKAIDNATAPIRKVNEEIKRVGASVTRMSGSLDLGSRSTKRFAMGALQQAGYQVGDFAVQVANGTSQIQAFGQQAPQMLQIFGPIGAVAGAAIAILAAFGVAVQKSGKDLTDMGTALGVLQKPLSYMLDSIKAIGSAIGSVFGGISGELDTAIIAVGLFAGVMAIKALPALFAATGATTLFSAAMATFRAAVLASAISAGTYSTALILVRASVMTLGAALTAVGGILLRFLPIALLIGAAKLIELFLRLKEGAGGFGNAMKLLWDLVKSVFTGMGGYANGFMLVIGAVSAGIVAKFINAFSAIMGKWQSLVNGMISGWNGFVTSVGMESMVAESYVSDWAQSASDSVKAWEDASISASGRAQEAFSNAKTGISDAWNALTGAVAAGTTEVTVFGNASAEAASKSGAAASETLDRMKELSSSIREAFSGAFMSMVDGTKTVAGAFKEMAKQIILKLYEVFVVQKMVNAAMGLVQSVFPSLAPAVATPALSGVRAMGGQVTAGNSYLVGERGPEMIVPSRNANVVPNNKMGGGGVTVNQTINITTGVQQTVRAEIKSLMPQIADSAKAAVLDAKRRGGSYGSAFA